MLKLHEKHVRLSKWFTLQNNNIGKYFVFSNEMKTEINVAFRILLFDLRGSQMDPQHHPGDELGNE